ncbi:hypothetical protein ACIKTA_03965 [Hansschlegelia beijingensis]
MIRTKFDPSASAYVPENDHAFCDQVSGTVKPRQTPDERQTPEHQACALEGSAEPAGPARRWSTGGLHKGRIGAMFVHQIEERKTAARLRSPRPASIQSS